MEYAYTHKRTVRPGSPLCLKEGEVAVEYDMKYDVYEEPTDRERFSLWALECWEMHFYADLEGEWTGDVFHIE